MERLVFLILLFGLCTAQVTFVPPYQSQCPGSNAVTYEKTFPCSWNDYELVWDYGYTKFICDNVPSTFTYNYSITNNDASNIQPFSAALWDDANIDSENTVDAYIPYQYSDYQYTTWLSGIPSVRFNSLYFIQPINSPYYTDFSGNNQNVTDTVYNSNRIAVNGVILYINRENLTPEFPCFNLTVSVNIY